MLLAAIDWTMVILGALAIIPPIFSAWLSYLILRAIRTPSGDNIGAVVERGHDLSAVSAAGMVALRKRLKSGESIPADDLPTVEPDR